MDWWLLTFFLGAILSLFLPEVPVLFQLFLLLFVSITFFSYKQTRFSAGLWFGALWMLSHAYVYHQQLPTSFIEQMKEKQLFIVEGEVVTLMTESEFSTKDPTKQHNAEANIAEIKTYAVKPKTESRDITKRFNFLINTINHQPLESPIKVRLRWNKAEFDIFQGNELALNVKLKPVHGLLNLGGFNYLTWLKADDIVATGYVVNKKNKQNTKLKLKKVNDNKIINATQSFRQLFFNQYQQSSLSWVQLQSQSNHLIPVLLALTFGDRSSLSKAHWKVLQSTGTSHLIAISGLHIGLLASGTFFLVMFVFQYMPLRNPRWQQLNIRYIAILTSVAFATVYAYLAGFSLPTQRALLMLSLYWCVRLLGLNLSLKRMLLIAVFILLIYSPFSLLTASFWLSFFAVSIIFVTLWRFKSWLRTGSLIHRFIKGLILIQITLTLMLLPMSALFFQQVSLSALLANIIAVPWMSFVSIPTALLSLLLTPLNEQLSQWFMLISLNSLSWFWHYLEFLNRYFEIILISRNEQLMIVIIGILFFLFYYLVPLRLILTSKKTKIVLITTAILISTLSLVSIFNDKNNNTEILVNGVGESENALNKKNKVAFKPWKVEFLDVGQGLSILMQRNNQAILYDTGASYPSGFNMSESVILPYLRYLGINTLDKLILSHSDNDHAGGISQLLAGISILQIMTNDRDMANSDLNEFSLKSGETALKGCSFSDSFNWQGLSFDILWPLKDQHHREKQKNDDSCVILITDENNQGVLLTGDISEEVEHKLTVLYPSLNFNVLQVPHHGSKTSSSEYFLKYTSPDVAVITAGYLNRWNMPSDLIKQRYRKAGIKLLNTAELGQIQIIFNESGINHKNYVDHLRPFWSTH